MCVVPPPRSHPTQCIDVDRSHSRRSRRNDRRTNGTPLRSRSAWVSEAVAHPCYRAYVIPGDDPKKPRAYLKPAVGGRLQAHWPSPWLAFVT